MEKQDILDVLGRNGAGSFAYLIRHLKLRQIIRGGSIVFAPSNNIINTILLQFKVSFDKFRDYPKMGVLVRNFIVNSGDTRTLSGLNIEYDNRGVRVSDPSNPEDVSQKAPYTKAPIQVGNIIVYVINGFFLIQKQNVEFDAYMNKFPKAVVRTVENLNKKQSPEYEVRKLSNELPDPGGPVKNLSRTSSPLKSSPKSLPKSPTKRTPKQKYPNDCVFEDAEVYETDRTEKCEVDDDGSFVDGITYEVVAPENLARIRCGGKLYCYDIKTLHGLLETDPKDPITRRPFNSKFKNDILGKYGKTQGTVATSVIPDALRRLDQLYEPVESTLNFSERIPKHTLAEYKRVIKQSKDQAIAVLKDSNIDEDVRVYLVFGDDVEKSPTINYVEEVTRQVNNAEFS